MAKKMKGLALFSILLTVFCVIIYIHMHIRLFFILAITFGTTSYHLIMRLFVGFLLNLLLHNHVNYRKKWFQASALEQKLYGILRVKKWKTKMPTYDPECFDSKIHSWDEIVQAMCQAELVHEVIIIFSFAPVFAAIFWGALWVFVTTSVLSACFDAMFVIIQRFNRPRVIKLIEKQIHF